MRIKKKRKTEENATPDLTPMIDVTFQLLIFFILCTRFKVDERNYQVELPLDEGPAQPAGIPKEQLTIYSAWDGQTNHYKLAIGSRARKVVEGSHRSMNDLVITSTDTAAEIRSKKATYKQTVIDLGTQIDSYIENSGAKIEKIELAYAKDSSVGVASGTTPWMFLSLAIDAAAHVNKQRAAHDQLPVVFKFADARQRYQR